MAQEGDEAIRQEVERRLQEIQLLKQEAQDQLVAPRGLAPAAS
jgi:hypothetical protein